MNRGIAAFWDGDCMLGASTPLVLGIAPDAALELHGSPAFDTVGI